MPKNRGHITKEWKWQVAGILDPCMGLLKKQGCERSYQRLIMLCKMYSDRELFLPVSNMGKSFHKKTIPSSMLNKVYNNSFFTPGLLGRFDDIIPPVYHGTKGKLSKFHHLLPLLVGYRWHSLIVRESAA